jgi:transposase, IS5 family
LKISVLKHKLIFKSCTQLAADRIYPTNENRKFITAQKIQSNFDKKGPKSISDTEKEIKGELSKGRNSYMEGAFGNHKNHYSLRKIKARSKPNERIWLFFGVMTANAVAIA